MASGAYHRSSTSFTWYRRPFSTNRRGLSSALWPEWLSTVICMVRNASRNNHRRPVNGVPFHGRQGLIRLLQRKQRNLRPQPDFCREVQKIPRILSGHVRYAANLPFAPEQPVVIELRHAIQVDGIDRHYS